MANETPHSDFATLLATLLRGELTLAQAEQMSSLGTEIVLPLLMAANARLAELQSASADSPSPSSGSVPVYLKPKTSGRRKKPGAKRGHKGSRRKTPVKIDEKVEHRLDVCPCYNNVFTGDKQKCLPHLLRELLKVDEYNLGIEWKVVSKQLKRLIRDGLRLRKRPDFTADKYRSRMVLINRRLWALADTVYQDTDANRLGGRIGKFRDELFTFLDTAGVPPDNNHAERMIRPAVIIRKNSLCNRSEQGAATQAILMSIYRTR